MDTPFFPIHAFNVINVQEVSRLTAVITELQATVKSVNLRNKPIYVFKKGT